MLQRSDVNTQPLGGNCSYIGSLIFSSLSLKLGFSRLLETNGQPGVEIFPGADLAAHGFLTPSFFLLGGLGTLTGREFQDNGTYLEVGQPMI